MQEKLTRNGFNLGKHMNKKNFIVFITALSFFGAIIYMQIGGSENIPYQNSERPVVLVENPKQFDNEALNQQTNDTTGGFNTTGFDNFGFDPPAELLQRFPEGFACPSCKGIPDIPENEPGVVDPDFDERDIIDFPPGLDPGIINRGKQDDYQNLTGSDNYRDGDDKIFDYDPEKGTSSSQQNITLTERSDKARNLPRFDFIDLSFINFGSYNPSGVMSTLKSNSLIFIALLAMPIVIINKIVPNFVNKLDEFDDETHQQDSLFVLPKNRMAQLKRKKERVQRLLVFGDHIRDLVKRSEIRIQKKTPSHTIIIGYYELDEAFSKFTPLKRTSDTTPLEHSRQYFETGEVDNEVLEKIVDLFYLTRFASIEIKMEDGLNFVSYLNRLIPSKSEITQKLKSIEYEIQDNLEQSHVSTLGNSGVSDSVAGLIDQILSNKLTSFLLIGQSFASKVDKDKFSQEEDFPPELMKEKFLLHPVRLAILKILMSNTQITSAELRSRLDINWGDYANHTKALSQREYIILEDKIIDNTKKQVIFLTPIGISKYRYLIDLLLEYLGDEL